MTRLLLAALLIACTSPGLAQAPEASLPSAPTAAPAPVDAAQAPSLPAARDDHDDADLPPDVLARLSPDQLVKVLQARENSAVAMKQPPMVAMVVPLAAFVATVLIVVFILRFRQSQHAKLHETMQRMIEKGAEIPPALFLPPRERNADLRKGLILMGAGVGLAITLFIMGDHGTYALGLVPLFVGAGYLLVWLLERKRKEA